jgi:hypothetical protein
MVVIYWHQGGCGCWGCLVETFTCGKSWANLLPVESADLQCQQGKTRQGNLRKVSPTHVRPSIRNLLEIALSGETKRTGPRSCVSCMGLFQQHSNQPRKMRWLHDSSSHLTFESRVRVRNYLLFFLLKTIYITKAWSQGRGTFYIPYPRNQTLLIITSKNQDPHPRFRAALWQYP